MKVLGRHERYRKVSASDTAELIDAHYRTHTSLWYPQYHIGPISGNLASISNIQFYHGNWHVYYEVYPFESVYGANLWYHVISKDLVVFENEGIAIKPDTWFDNAGCHIGSSIVEDDLMYITYTGENRDDAWLEHPNQMVAAMNEDHQFIKHDAPIIQEDIMYNTIQSSPLLFKRMEDNMYYILLGVETKDAFGQLILYRSQEVYQGWKKMGRVRIKGYPVIGEAISAVDLKKIGEQYILILRIHGQVDDIESPYHINTYYFIGDLDLYHMEFIPTGPLRLLDEGLDYDYARCAYDPMNTNAIVTMGVLANSFTQYKESQEEGWNNYLSLPRKLTISHSQLYQQPFTKDTLKDVLLFEAKEGQIETDRMHALMPRSCVMEIDNPRNHDFVFNLFCWGRDRGFEFSYNHTSQTFMIDRGSLRHPVSSTINTKKLILAEPLTKVEVFVDKGSVEIFLNEGKYVLSSRIFPAKDETMIRMGGKDIDVRIYQAKATIDNTFHI